MLWKLDEAREPNRPDRIRTVEMKAIALLAVLGSAFYAGFVLPQVHAAKPSGVGVRPGDIGKKMDILTSARERGHDLAMFAGGCFWGTEGEFRLQKGVVATAVGYTGGTVPNPTYEMVCSHTTGHAEATLVEFDPKQTSYEALVEFFFEIHNPTQRDGQGPDIGSNYRPAIFYFDEHQREVAQKIKERLQDEKFKGREIATEVTKAGPFFMAEDYHQQYYEKRGMAPACHIKS